MNRDTLLFARNFFLHPLRNASIVPSSPSVSKMMLAGLDFSKIKVIVELGPGIGNLTEDILKRCNPGTKIILIEYEASYVENLRKKFGDKVIVEQTSAHLMDDVLKKYGIQKVDFIASTLPILPPSIRLPFFEALARHTQNGTIFRFITYIQPITMYVYRQLGVRRISFSFKNFPPVWVNGVN